MESAIHRKWQINRCFGKCKTCEFQDKGYDWCNNHWGKEDCCYKQEENVPIQFEIRNVERTSLSGTSDGLRIVTVIPLDEARKLHKRLDDYLKMLDA